MIFALELTHDVNVLLPLLVASFIAHGFTVLTLKRSILTEKIARRGYHLSREYALDPLEILFARDVMRTSVVVLRSDQRLDAGQLVLHADGHRGQHLYPVVGPAGEVRGVLTRKQISRLTNVRSVPPVAADVMTREPVVAYADEPLRMIVFRMAERQLTRLPVVERAPTARLVGMISLQDLLHARTRVLTEERERERVLRLRMPFQRVSS